MSGELVDTKTGELVSSERDYGIVKRAIAPSLTDEEFKVFLMYCQAKGLDPVSREIYPIRRKDKVTYQMAIDGLRSLAETTGEYDGSEVHWCGPDGKWVDVWTKPEPPYAARVQVWKAQTAKPFVGVALWNEYKPAENDFIWKKMPSNQLAKCAEALALRKAFPRKLGGLYANEEMGQAKSDLPAVIPPRRKNRGDDHGQPVADGGDDRRHGDRTDEPTAVAAIPGRAAGDEPVIEFGAEAPTAAQPKPRISDAQRRLLHAKRADKGVSPERLKKAIQTLYGLGSTADLNGEQLTSLLALLDKGAIREP